MEGKRAHTQRGAKMLDETDWDLNSPRRIKDSRSPKSMTATRLSKEKDNKLMNLGRVTNCVGHNC